MDTPMGVRQKFESEFIQNSQKVQNREIGKAEGYRKNYELLLNLIKDNKNVSIEELAEALKNVKINLESPTGFAASPELRIALRTFRNNGEAMKFKDLAKFCKPQAAPMQTAQETAALHHITTLEDAPTMLATEFKRATVDSKTSSNYGGLKPGVDDYNMCNKVEIFSASRLPAELGTAKHKFPGSDKFIVMTFDERSFAQGGTIGGVGDFKMGMLHQALADKFGSDGYIWEWQHDYPCEVLIPLEADKEMEIVNKVASLAAEPFAKQLIDKLELGPVVIPWGINPIEMSTTLEMHRNENNFLIAISPAYRGERIQRALAEQWPQASFELNADQTQLIVRGMS
jgi:hypothetical protein